MLPQKIEEAFNTQMNKEIFSAYLYKAMSAIMAEENFDGFANWLDVQAREEYAHAMGFYNNIILRGGKINFEPIDRPELKERTPLALFERVLEHEQYITASINEVYAIAKAENDVPAELLLHWYIREQLEEETSAQKIIDTLKMIGNDKNALFMLDHEFKTRQFIQPDIK